jgi:hypothetical protein
MRKKTHHKTSRMVVCFFISVSVWGCAPRQFLVSEVADMVAEGISAFEEEDDLYLVEKALPANIKLLEILLKNNPENRTLLILLARLYGSYAFAFFEGKLEKATLTDDTFGGASDQSGVPSLSSAASRYYEKGMAFALSALAVRHGSDTDALKKVSLWDSFFERLSREDVPALFWYAFNLGSYVNLNRQNVQAISQASLMERAMRRVIELDADYFYGIAHLFLFIHYASRPPMMGGNMDKAEFHYHALLKSAGSDFLLGDVYYARFYLTRVQNRKAYEETLMRVLQSPPPDTCRLYNKIATLKAEVYLNAADRFFD